MYIGDYMFLEEIVSNAQIENSILKYLILQAKKQHLPVLFERFEYDRFYSRTEGMSELSITAAYKQGGTFSNSIYWDIITFQSHHTQLFRKLVDIHVWRCYIELVNRFVTLRRLPLVIVFCTGCFGDFLF